LAVGLFELHLRGCFDFATHSFHLVTTSSQVTG
jgi:hypothetical protein